VVKIRYMVKIYSNYYVMVRSCSLRIIYRRWKEYFFFLGLIFNDLAVLVWSIRRFQMEMDDLQPFWFNHLFFLIKSIIFSSKPIQLLLIELGMRAGPPHLTRSAKARILNRTNKPVIKCKWIMLCSLEFDPRYPTS
jgi:hypothetical protein